MQYNLSKLYYFMVEKPNEHDLSPLIKANITRDKS